MMRIRHLRPALFASAAASALQLAACGGPQPAGALGGLPFGAVPATADPLGWLATHMPEDATYAFAQDLLPEVSAVQTEGLLGWPPATLGALREATGRAFTTPEDWAATGLSLSGDVAAFSTSVLPVVLIRLDDADAFAALIQDVLDRNPDLTGTRSTFLGHRAWTIAVDELAVFVAATPSYAVVRVSMPEYPALSVDDATLTRVLVDGGGSLATAPDVARLTARRPAEMRLIAFGRADLARLFRAWDAADVGDRYSDAEERARCGAAMSGMATAMPGFAFASASAPASGDEIRSWAVSSLELGDAAAETAARVLSIAPPVPADAITGAAVALSLGIDLRAVIESASGDADLARCPDLAAIAGGLATAAAEGEEYIGEIERYWSGWGTLALFAIRGGLVPAVDAVVGFGTSDPVAVMGAVQGAIERQGGVGQVDPTAPFTTIAYSWMGQTIRLVQRPDRVAASVGDVPPSVANALAADAAGGTGAPFFTMSMNGPALRSALDVALGMATAAGAATPEVTAVGDQLAIYDRIPWARMSGRLVGREVLFEIESALRLDGE